MEYPTIVRAKDLTNLPFYEKMVVVGLEEWPARTAVGIAYRRNLLHHQATSRCI